MIRLNYAGRSVLVGTEAASLLLRYTAALPVGAPAEPVALHVINEQGDLENFIVLAGGVGQLVAEVTDEDFGPEPENVEAALFLRSRLKGSAAATVAGEPAADPAVASAAAAPPEPATPV